VTLTNWYLIEIKYLDALGQIDCDPFGLVYEDIHYFVIFKPYIETFQKLVKQYFKGYLKPPFDIDGRNSAGMTGGVKSMLRSAK
jgi:hypothetical protein